MPEWNELFLQKEFRWNQPAPELVQAVEQLDWPEPATRKVLDLGCGAGRHCAWLAARGYQVYGTDIAENGLRFTQERLEHAGLRAELQLADMSTIPWPDAFFDLIVSHDVIHHNRLEVIQRCVGEIARTLKPGGHLYLSLKSASDSSYGSGQPLEAHTFVPQAGHEAGIPHHFFDRGRLQQLLTGFRLLNLHEKNIHFHLRKGEEIEGVNSHWVLLAVKNQ